MKYLLSIAIAVFTYQFVSAQVSFQKTLGITGFNVGWGVQVTNDNGFIITGVIDSIPGGSGIFLVKTDSNGDTAWARIYEVSIGGGGGGGRAVQQTSDGGYIVTGFTSGGNGAFLLKTDGLGNISWTKTFSGSSIIEGEAVFQTSDGGYLVTSSGNLINLIRTDSNGDTLWTRNYASSGFCEAYSGQQTNDGGYIISGYTSTASSPIKFFLLKLDVNGDSLWTRTFGGSGNAEGRTVKQTSDDGYIITGKAFASFSAGGEDIYLVKTDSVGNVEWSKVYGGIADDRAYYTEQTDDGGFIVVGETESFGAGDKDVYLLKTDAYGTLLWSKTFGGTGWDQGRSIQQTVDDGYIITGLSGSFTTNFMDIYLIKTDANGYTGCNESTAATIPDTALTVVGYPGFTISSGVITSSPVVFTTIGLPMTTLCFTSGLEEVKADYSILVYPNPATDNLTIYSEREPINGTIEIINSNGKCILMTKVNSESKMEINLNHVSDGIYFVKIFDGNYNYCKKIILNHD